MTNRTLKSRSVGWIVDRSRQMFLACAYRVLSGFTGFYRVLRGFKVGRLDCESKSTVTTLRRSNSGRVVGLCFFSCPNSFRQKERREKKGKQKRKRSQQKGRQRKQESATNSPNRWREEHKTHQHGRPFSISIPRRQQRPDGEKRSPPHSESQPKMIWKRGKENCFTTRCVSFFLSFFFSFR